MLQMIVKGIGLDSNSGQPILVLTDKSRSRALPILIGTAEASSISYGLSKAQVERPLTHDLLLNSIRALGYKVTRVDLNDEKNGAYIASITLESLNSSRAEMTKDIESLKDHPNDSETRNEADEKVIDARPSDAIALAVREDIPIYVHESLIMSGSIPIDEQKEQDEKEEFSKFISSVKASDFKLPNIE